MNMNDAALPGNIREYVVYSAYYVVSAISCNANDLISQVSYTEQICSNLILIFVISEAIEDSPLQVLCTIQDKAVVVGVIRAINEEIDWTGRVHCPGGRAVQIIIEPSMELARTIPTSVGNLINGHPA